MTKVKLLHFCLFGLQLDDFLLRVGDLVADLPQFEVACITHFFAHQRIVIVIVHETLDCLETASALVKVLVRILQLGFGCTHFHMACCRVLVGRIAIVHAAATHIHVSELFKLCLRSLRQARQLRKNRLIAQLNLLD